MNFGSFLMPFIVHFRKAIVHTLYADSAMKNDFLATVKQELKWSNAEPESSSTTSHSMRAPTTTTKAAGFVLNVNVKISEN